MTSVAQAFRPAVGRASSPEGRRYASGPLETPLSEATQTRKDFLSVLDLDGIALVQQVAEAAEAADHHPDIDIRWRTVTFRLVTHSAGGVTAKDIGLARTIDTMIASGWSA